MSKLKKAMEKAKAERENVSSFSASPVSPSWRGPVAAAPSAPFALKENTDEKKTCVQGLSVAYTKTRVQPVDPNVLKRNKVISLFHDNNITDRMKTLRTQILNHLEKVGGNSLLITSANPGEGKTFMAINLGISIAQEIDRTVLVVDADLRIPAKGHLDFSRDFLGLGKGKGFSDYLKGDAEIEDLLLNPGIEKFTILPAGSPVVNSAELLGSPRTEALIKEMRERYCDDRIIIIDGPALLTSSDPLVLAHAIDAVLLVVEAERTTPGQVKRCMELLKDCSIMGVVLNKSK